MYVAVIMDKMKIQQNLVFDKSSGALIGFIDLGHPLTTYANVDEDTPIGYNDLTLAAQRNIAPSVSGNVVNDMGSKNGSVLVRSL